MAISLIHGSYFKINTLHNHPICGKSLQKRYIQP